ncbi:thiol-activated cytolysin family protein [Cellulophaga fucicola]|uniref:Thiol-activated cytolysin n=1 Tax=Cellulophaga fucicola TaxID=76595 RepID=A0A1K1M9L4_9FLAO|nr:thiol-activated cytolysin family protein [Cellulophaga fucicola]SFW19828.1 thiol-activated cytolysin [Cellulophaga fucicola]
MKVMYLNKLRTNLWVFLMLLATIISCNKDEEPKEEEAVPETFSSVLAMGKELEEPIEEETEVESTEKEESITKTDDNGLPVVESWKCTTTTYDLKKGTGGEEGFPLFSPNAKIIYPGSLLQGKTLKNTTPDVISVDRAGGTISYDLVNGNASSNVSVDVVSKSSIQAAMNKIIAASPNVAPANFTFEYEQVQTREALAISMGLDVKSAFVKAGASFDFENEDNSNRILVKLKQTFYTMSMDLPTSLDDLFADSVTPQDLAKYVQDDNPATYISDVTYGRVYYMLIESSSSYQELNVAVNASFGAFGAKVKADLEVDYLKELSNLNIKVIAFGGDTESTISSIGVTNLSTLVGLLSKSAVIGSGLPISYVVRSVNTNQIVGVQLATELSETECIPLFSNGEPIQTKHWRGNILNKMGGVGAAFERNSGEFILINKTGDKYIRSYNGELDGPYDVTNLFEGDFPFFTGDKNNNNFDGIGAIVNIRNNSNEDSIDNERQFLAISKSGLQFKYASGNSWESFTSVADLSVEKLSTIGNNPFGVSGIGAALNVFYEVEDKETGYYKSSLHFFNKVGTKRTLFWSGSRYGKGGEISDSSDLTSTFSQYKNIPFTAIGAALRFDVGGSKKYIIFDITGTKYTISDITSATGFSPAYSL